jgi:GAF domain
MAIDEAAARQPIFPPAPRPVTRPRIVPPPDPVEFRAVPSSTPAFRAVPCRRAEYRVVTRIDEHLEGKRLAAVRRYHVLDTPPDGAFDRVASLAAKLFDAPIGLVTIVDEDRVWIKAAHGLDGVRQVERDPGLCASVVLRDGPYVVGDALTDPRTLSHPLVLGEFGLRFYAAAPIVTSDGYRLGTVNVVDRGPREITVAQARLLEDLAGIVMDELELRLSALRVVGLERRRGILDLTRSEVEEVLRGFQARESKACQLGGAPRCTGAVETKVVDLTGMAVWACINHAAEALTSIPGAFLATPDAPSLASLTRLGPR